MSNFFSVVFLILLSVSFVEAQVSAIDTNIVTGKIFTITADKNYDVKNMEVVVTEGFGSGIIKYPILDQGKCTDEKYPQNTGLFHLHVSYAKKKSKLLFLYTTDPAKEKISIHLYKEGKIVLCRVTSILSEDMNKVIVLEE